MPITAPFLCGFFASARKSVRVAFSSTITVYCSSPTLRNPIASVISPLYEPVHSLAAILQPGPSWLAGRRSHLTPKLQRSPWFISVVFLELNKRECCAEPSTPKEATIHANVQAHALAQSSAAPGTRHHVLRHKSLQLGNIPELQEHKQSTTQLCLYQLVAAYLPIVAPACQLDGPGACALTGTQSAQ